MKALFQGAPFVVAAALLLGAALQPQLAVSDDPRGPQMLMGVSARHAPPDVSWAAYNGPVPDYVLGTDWTRPPDYPATYEEPSYVPPEPDPYLPIEAPLPEPVIRQAEPVVATQVIAPRYPSEGGEVVVSHAPAAPDPEPQELVEAFPPV